MISLKSVSYFDSRSSKYWFLNIFNILNKIQINRIHRNWKFDSYTFDNNLHNLEKRATPMNFAKYRLAIQLYKIYNDLSSTEDWSDMNFQQNFNARQDTCHITNTANTKVGRNIICNRLTVLNNQIKLNWLNLSMTAFKLQAKRIFLTQWLMINDMTV